MKKKEKKFLLLISPFELLAGLLFFFARHKIKREKNNLVAEYVSVYVNDWLTLGGIKEKTGWSMTASNSNS